MAITSVNSKVRAILYGDHTSRIVRSEEELQDMFEKGIRSGYPAPMEHWGWFYQTDISDFDIMTGFFIPDDGSFVAEIRNKEAFFERYALFH